MTHFGILCPPGTGHLNNFMALGYELKKRRHRVTLFGLLDVETYAVAAQLEFVPLGTNRFPIGSTTQSQRKLGELNGIPALIYTIDLFRKGTEVLLSECPKAFVDVGVEVLLADQVLLEASSIAEHLGLPFITICSALMLNSEQTISPALLGWDYDPSWFGQMRNQIGSHLLQLAGTPIQLLVNNYRREWGMKHLNAVNQLNLWSKKAIICQQPTSFEFPRQNLPDYFHFTGPLTNNISRAKVPFPWKDLTDKPLIYASLGTIQNKLLWVFIQIAYACLDVDVQLVISLGGATEPSELGHLPGSPIVLKAVPQLELIQKASLCITHAGMNTTLESLTYGVPMVAIPITNDQPAIATRIAWTKTGKVVNLDKCNVESLKIAIKEVLTQPEYRQNALKIKADIEQAGGVNKAADIIEAITSH